MYETSSVSESNTSWDNSLSNFPLNNSAGSARGGMYSGEQPSGIFTFSRYHGPGYYYDSWRASLTLFCRVYFFKEKFRKGKEVITNF